MHCTQLLGATIGWNNTHTQFVASKIINLEEKNCHIIKKLNAVDGVKVNQGKYLLIIYTVCYYNKSILGITQLRRCNNCSVD